MPLDTSIALGVRPVQLDDPQIAQAKRLQLRSLMMQQQAAEQAQGDRAAVADAYRGAYGADGTVDQNTLYQRLAAGGQGAQIPAAQKQFTEAAAAKTKLSGEQFDLAKKKLDASQNAIGGLSALGPNVTHQDVIGTVNNLVQQGIMDQQAGAQLVRSLPGNPQALPAYLRQANAQVLTARERLEMMTPKYEKVDLGGSMQMVDVNPNTNGGQPQSLAKTVSPDAQLGADTSRSNNAATVGATYASIAETRRGHDLTNARALESNAKADTAIEKDSQGNMMLVSKRDGTSRPVTGADGKPLNFGAGQADAKEALKLIDQALPMLKSSTGSWFGKGLDVVAGTFGVATPGSIDASKLKAIEGALVAKMPKMSGPQSDKDVAMYKQMAGAIGDDSVPYERKSAALDTIREIQERYAGMAPGSSKPVAAPTPPVTARRGGSASEARKPVAGDTVDWNSLK